MDETQMMDQMKDAFKDAPFPMDKDQLIDYIKSQNLPQDQVDMLEKRLQSLPEDQEFNNPEDVINAMKQGEGQTETM